MAESQAMQSIINNAIVQAATAVMMAIRHADVGPRSAVNTANPREHQRQRYGGPALEKPSFD